MALVKAGEEFERFGYAHFIGKRGGLQSGANFVLEGVGLFSRVIATDNGSAAVSIAQTFQDFDGAGFAGSVGAEKAEDFAFADAEAEAAHSFHVAVALNQIFHSQDGFGHKQDTKLYSKKRFHAPRPGRGGSCGHPPLVRIAARNISRKVPSPIHVNFGAKRWRPLRKKREEGRRYINRLAEKLWKSE